MGAKRKIILAHGLWHMVQMSACKYMVGKISYNHANYITYNSAKDTSMGDDVSMGQLNDDECNAPFDLYDQAVGNDASCVDDVCSKACLRMVLL